MSTGYQGGKLVDYYRLSIPQNSYRGKVFECRTQSKLAKKGSPPMTEVASYMKLTVDKVVEDKKVISRLNILSSEVDSTNKETMEFANLIKLMSTPTQRVDVRLDKTGKIHEIINARYIYDRWIEVYNILRKEFTDENFLQGLREQGNNDYTNLKETIGRILLYNIFYLPVFDDEYKFGKNKSYELAITSNVLNSEKVDIVLRDKEIKINNPNLCLTLIGQARNGDHIAKKAMQTYASLLEGHKTDYEFEINVKYEIDMFDGCPNNIEVYFKENLTDLFFYEQTMTIKEVIE